MYHHPFDRQGDDNRGHEMLAYVIIFVVFVFGFIAGALLV